MQKSKIIVGAHVSISGQIYQSIQRAEDLGATTMQIFTKSNRQWLEKDLSENEIKMFKQVQKESTISDIVAHTGYLINIASSNPIVEKKSTKSLEKELIRCQQLEIPYLVLHPGAHTGAGLEAGIKKAIKNLDYVIKDASGKTKILLETMAGQGTTLGSRFEEISEILGSCKNNRFLGVCFDTCHAFSAGYDISSQEKYEKTMNLFDRIIGIKYLKAIHINNSKTPCNSKKDRHEELTKGTIPLKTFEAIMKDKKLEGVPKILETPNPLKYKEEIQLLKSFA